MVPRASKGHQVPSSLSPNLDACKPGSDGACLLRLSSGEWVTPVTAYLEPFPGSDYTTILDAGLLLKGRLFLSYLVCAEPQLLAVSDLLADCCHQCFSYLSQLWHDQK